jgi:hypothetical protein
MNQSSANLPAPSGGGFLLYQTADGRTRIQCRFEQGVAMPQRSHRAEVMSQEVEEYVIIDATVQSSFAR